MMMKKWETVNQFKVQSSKFKVEDLIKIILKNRGIKTKKDVDLFLDPKLEEVTTGSVGIEKSQLKTALKRIQKAIDNKEQIVVFGDYDVDGICGTAILWETLYRLGALVAPYIPHRIDEGYGLSKKGIQNLESRVKNVTLIITVDNGIVANEAVAFAKKEGIDVIITDHHVPGEVLPSAHAFVHTTALCGTGVAYLLSQEIVRVCHLVQANAWQSLRPEPSEGSKPVGRDSSVSPQNDSQMEDHLELVALATVADLVSLTKANRILLKFGLLKLRNTKRVGLKALFQESKIQQEFIGVYEIGHVIAPRLNAMGRLEGAMDSLRLICTTNKMRAQDLAFKIGQTNLERQKVTEETVLHAKTFVRSAEVLKHLLFVSNDTYQQGVIGLVAGKLVEEFYRPSIVVSIGQPYSKASARSVSGFNIIEFIRGAGEHLVDVGGHPMAAGFTVETEKLILLQEVLEAKAQELLSVDKLTRVLKIDCELPIENVSKELYQSLQVLSPFGMGNVEPTFVSKAVTITDVKVVGRDGKHVKLRLTDENGKTVDAIAFGLSQVCASLKQGDKADIVYTIDENTWNGSTTLQLKIKDIHKSN